MPPEVWPTYWAYVEAGTTALGRDGQPRRILAVSSTAPGSLVVTTADGSWPVDPRQPVLILAPTMQEATAELLVAFPATTIIEREATT